MAISHDKMVLENMLMSFKVKNAKARALELTTKISNIKNMDDLDYSVYGTEKNKIRFAMKCYASALGFIQTYYK
jgi:hypothetical protein